MHSHGSASIGTTNRARAIICPHTNAPSTDSLPSTRSTRAIAAASKVKLAGLRAADGGYRYPGSCRAQSLPTTGWRSCNSALRFRLEPGWIAPADESGFDLAQDPSAAMGDPVLRRRDGAVAYQLAVVVDDAEQAVTRIVRGRDLAPSTAIQVALQRALGFATPTYRHHLLLLEERGDKFAKAARCGGMARTARALFAGTVVRLPGSTS